MLLPGALAPDFDVPAHDGSRVRLSNFAGSYVLLWFYKMKKYSLNPKARQ